MHLNETKFIQTSFECHVWRSPDTLFKAIFARLSPSCELDPFSGVVIITDAARKSAYLFEVSNLRMDLPALLTGVREPVVYWLARSKQHERSELISGLTPNPVFLS